MCVCVRCVCVCRAKVGCSVGTGVKAVGWGCRGVRGKERRAVREGAQGGWRHFFWVGLPVVGVLEVTVWNL